MRLRLFAEDFAAYPACFRLSNTVWDSYPMRGGNGLRRLLRLMNHSRTDTLLLRRSAMPLGWYGIDAESFRRWLDGVIGQPYRLCFFWPSPKRSADRFYAYAVHASGDAVVGYLKFALSDEEGEALQRERRGLAMLEGRGVRTFLYPRCLAQMDLGGGRGVMAFEPLPPDAHVPKFVTNSWDGQISACQRSFATPIVRVPYARIVDERWFRRFQARADPGGAFTKAVLASMRDGIDVCLTHGDFACHNILTSAKCFWIVDWEECTELGPCLADEICFFLCVRRYEMGWSMRRVVAAFRAAYLDRGEPLASRSLQAIAFLFGLKISMGLEMAAFCNRHFARKAMS
jgi:hypothetical protein